MLDHYGIVTKKKCTNVRCEQPSLREGGARTLVTMDAIYLLQLLVSLSNLKLLCYFSSVTIMKLNCGVKTSRLLWKDIYVCSYTSVQTEHL